MSTDAIECQTCHNQLPPRARFCPVCGTARPIDSSAANRQPDAPLFDLSSLFTPAQAAASSPTPTAPASQPPAPELDLWALFASAGDAGELPATSHQSPAEAEQPVAQVLPEPQVVEFASAEAEAVTTEVRVEDTAPTEGEQSLTVATDEVFESGPEQADEGVFDDTSAAEPVEAPFVILAKEDSPAGIEEEAHAVPTPAAASDNAALFVWKPEDNLSSGLWTGPAETHWPALDERSPSLQPEVEPIARPYLQPEIAPAAIASPLGMPASWSVEPTQPAQVSPHPHPGTPEYEALANAAYVQRAGTGGGTPTSAAPPAAGIQPPGTVAPNVPRPKPGTPEYEDLARRALNERLGFGKADKS